MAKSLYTAKKWEDEKKKKTKVQSAAQAQKSTAARQSYAAKSAAKATTSKTTTKATTSKATTKAAKVQSAAQAQKNTTARQNYAKSQNTTQVKNKANAAKTKQTPKAARVQSAAQANRSTAARRNYAKSTGWAATQKKSLPAFSSGLKTGKRNRVEAASPLTALAQKKTSGYRLTDTENLLRARGQLKTVKKAVTTQRENRVKELETELKTTTDRREKAALNQELKEARNPLSAADRENLTKEEQQLTLNNKDWYRKIKEAVQSGTMNEKTAQELLDNLHGAVETLRGNYGYSGGEAGTDYRRTVTEDEDDKYLTAKGKQVASVLKNARDQETDPMARLQWDAALKDLQKDSDYFDEAAREKRYRELKSILSLPSRMEGYSKTELKEMRAEYQELETLYGKSLGARVKNTLKSSGLEALGSLQEVASTMGTYGRENAAFDTTYTPTLREQREGLVGTPQSRLENDRAMRLSGLELVWKATDTLNKAALLKENAKRGLSTAGKFGVDTAVAGTQLAADVAANMLAPGLGTGMMAARAFGSAHNQARMSGATDNEALAYGLGVGAVEALTERLFGASLPFKAAYGSGIKVAGKSVDEAATSALRKLLKNKTAADMIWKSGSEGLEEVIADAVNPVLRGVTYGDGVVNAYAEENFSDWLYDGLVGAVLGGAGGGVDIAVTGAKARQSNPQIENALIEEGLKKPEGTAGRVAAETAQNILNRGGALSDADVGELARTNASAAEKLTGNENLLRAQQEMDELVEQYAGLSAEEQKPLVPKIFAKGQEIDDYEAGVESGQVGLVRDDYTEGLDADVVQQLDDTARRLGVMVRFVDDIEGGIANAKYDSGKIYIEKDNPNPVRALYGHELTHHVQGLAEQDYLKFRDFVMENRGDEVAERIRAYAQAGVELTEEQAMDEIAADYAGALIEDRDLLTDFAQRADRSVVQRVLDALKELARKLTGGQRSQVDEAVRLLENAVSAAERNVGKTVESGARYSAEVGGGRHSLKGLDSSGRYLDEIRQEPAAKMQQDEPTEEPAAKVQREEPTEEPAAKVQQEESIEEPAANSQREESIEEPAAKGQRNEDSAVRKIARRLIRRQGRSNLKPEDIEDDLRSLYNTMIGGLGNGEWLRDNPRVGENALGNGRWMRNPQAREIALDIADKITGNAVTRDTEMYDQYSDLRTFLRETEIRVGPELRGDIADYGDFRKRQTGRMRLKNAESSNVDQVYQELSERWPELFDEVEVNNEVDQLLSIADAVNDVYTREDIDTYTEEQREELAERIANDVMYAVYGKRRKIAKEGDEIPELLREDASGVSDITTRNRGMTEEEKAWDERDKEQEAYQAESKRLDEMFRAIPVEERKVKGLPTGKNEKKKTEEELYREEYSDDLFESANDAYDEDYAAYSEMMQADEDRARRDYEDSLEGMEAPPEREDYQGEAEDYAAMVQEDEDRARRDYEDSINSLLDDAQREDEARIAGLIPTAYDRVQTKNKEDERTFRDKLRESKNFLYRRMVDSGDEIRKAGETAKDDALYPLFNAVRASTQAAQGWIGLQRSNAKGEKIGESLSDIFAPVKKKGDSYYKDFEFYLFNAHNVERAGTEQQVAALERAKQELDEFDAMYPDVADLNDRDLLEMAASGNPEAIERKRLLDNKAKAARTVKPIFGEGITRRDSQNQCRKLLEAHPEFAELAERVYAYEKDLLQLRVDAGIITQDLADKLWDIYPHYVPTFRMKDETKNRKLSKNVRVGKGVKKAVGGDDKLMPIDVSVGKQTMGTLRETAKNRFGQRLMDDSLDERYVKSQEKSGRNFKEGDFDALFEDSRPEVENTFTVYKDGEAYDVVVTPEMFEGILSFSPDTKYENLLPVRATRNANNLYKALITSKNPIFTAKNFLKDLQDALLYTQDTKGFLKNYPKSWVEIARNGENWRQYQALGGTASSVYDTEKGVQIPKTGAGYKLLRKIEGINLAVEQAPRLAEFMSLKEKSDGSFESLQKAMLGAADITTNFGRSGQWGKFLNRNFVPFLNPSIQGTDKLMRTIRDNEHSVKAWIALGAKCAALGVVPSVINYLLCGDEEDYDKLQQDTIDLNYLFPLGDGKWIKIPKGRVLSVFSALTNGTGRLLRGEDVDLQGIISLAGEQAGPVNPLSSNILKAWMDADLLNEDSPGKTWYGGDIESSRIQDLRPGERYDENTDVVSRFIGGKLGVSPAKINYLLDAYTGVIGDVALPLLTPTKTTGKNPFTKPFTLDTVMSNNLSEKFYDISDELGYDSADGDGKAAIAQKWWNKVGSDVSELNKELRALENDKGLSTKAKRDAVREKKKEVNAAMEEAMSKLEAYKKAVSENYTGDSDEETEKTFFAANRAVFGDEAAMELEGKDAYEKAQEAVAEGKSWKEYADGYEYKRDAKNIAKAQGWDTDESGSYTQEELYNGISAYTEDKAEREALFNALKSSNSKTTFDEAGEKVAAAKAKQEKMEKLAKQYNMTEDEIETVEDINDVGSYKAVYQALSGMDISDSDRNRYYNYINGKRNKAWKVTSWEGVVAYLKDKGEI